MRGIEFSHLSSTAVDAGMPRQYDRLNRSLFVIRSDKRGLPTAQMTVAQTMGDLRDGWTNVLGQRVLRLAIEIPTPTGTSVNTGKQGPPGKKWAPGGAIGISREGDGRIQRDEIQPLVVEMWNRMGWELDSENATNMQAIKYASI